MDIMVFQKLTLSMLRWADKWENISKIDSISPKFVVYHPKFVHRVQIAIAQEPFLEHSRINTETFNYNK